jgi:dephospho-CoA kinase
VKHAKPVIGLAGGIASGKSLVADILTELGAGVIDADELNHEVLSSDDVRRQIQKWWGRDTYDDAGLVDRRRLAEIVFSEQAKRKKLEDLTHPRVNKLRDQRRRAFEADERISAIVLDVPLLFEVGQDALCDKVIFVEVDESARIQRASEQRGWDAAELRRREELQIPLDTKREKSDHIVENKSNINTLRERVASVYHQILNPE